MKKIAIIGDVHFDIKDGSHNAFKYQRRFFDEIFIPHLSRVDGVVFLGDFFHNRRDVNFRILHEVSNLFRDILKINNNLYGVLGNHDFYFRNTYEVSSARNLGFGINFGPENSRWFVIEKKYLFVHWHNTTEELLQTFDEISKSIDVKNIEYIFGHFAIFGFNMNSKVINTEEESIRSNEIVKLFPNVKKVFSGHFHCPSEKGKIKYVGVPYHLTWAELNETLGFYILDSETSDVEFIENPYKAFEMIKVDNVEDPKQVLGKVEKTNYRKLYKIFYKNKEKEPVARYIYNQILNLGHDVLLIDENVFQIELNDNIEYEFEDNISIETIIKEYFMKNINVPEDEKEFYYDLFKSLYNELKDQLDTVEIE